ncbi:MAG: putative hydrolase of the HAD superfamily [Verrucomicrobia bacterium]|nr:MAG: putative hydrolase of the HAD superfamily [Verrucomicrobiota bacterium]
MGQHNFTQRRRNAARQNFTLQSYVTIRALIFDFDGLILDTESALISAYANVHAAHAVAFDYEHFLRSVGHADYAFDPWHAFEKRADRAALELERRAFNRERDLQLTLLPGVVALLDAARAHPLRVGLASNSGHAHCERHLARLGLLERFEFLACREDVPLPKPAPDLYKLVLNRFGLRGHEAIAFEDSHTGSLAAKRANLHVVAAPNPSTAHHDFKHVDLKVASLAEVKLDVVIARFGK